MEQVTAEISFIKVALGSFEDYEDEERRKTFLKSKLSLISDETLQEQLKGYVRLSEDKLEQQLLELQGQLKELQRKENLDKEEKLKLLGSSAEISRVFVISGVIRFAKSRAGCRHKLHRISEECHGKVRVGVSDDGISYQGVTKHLQFKVVFKEESQAEDFETAVKKIPLEYRKRKRIEADTSVVVPDIDVELQSIHREVWDGEFTRIEEIQYQKIAGDADPSPDYDPLASTQCSAVSITVETRLRLLEREDSPQLFRQKPEKCHIVRQADDKSNRSNANNIVFMSRFLHQHFDAIDSTEGIPTFYFKYDRHSTQPFQGEANRWPTPVYETVIRVVFKDEEAKNELIRYFRNPTEVDQTAIELSAYFPDPRQFALFAQSNAEETIAKWRSYDGSLDS